MLFIPPSVQNITLTIQNQQKLTIMEVQGLLRTLLKILNVLNLNQGVKMTV